MTKPKEPITITELKSIAGKKDLQAIMVLTVSRDGMVSIVTYGEDKKKCAAIGEWAQGLWHYAIALVPFSTVFGWGNKGRPMTYAEAQQLSESAKSGGVLTNV